LGDAVLSELPLIDVTAVDDGQLLSALFRDYTFLASAYLLEPCDLQWHKNQTYGLGREVLPRNIAIPLVSLARKLGAKPFMEYALSYALYNYRRIDPKQPLEFDNLELIRAFAGTPSERGFILVHVTMVEKSCELVRQTITVLNSVQNRDRSAFNAALKALRSNLQAINMEMETMWARSRTADYNNFRTFIMGIKSQPMFPKGVIYEGVS
jgi:indoleamine 2,3-dioxygenase